MTRMTVCRTSRLARKQAAPGRETPRPDRAHMHAQITAQHVNAGLPVSSSQSSARPAMASRPAGLQAAYHCPAARPPRRTAHRASGFAWLGKRAVQLLTLLRERSGRPRLSGTAAEILRSHRSGHSKDAQRLAAIHTAVTSGLHERNLIQLAGV